MKKGKKPNTKRKLGVVAVKYKKILDTMSKTVGKGGKVSTSKAMIEAGYSESYANSGNIKKKKTWQQLMDIYLPEDLLAQKHYELLNAKELDYFVFPKTMKDEEIEERMAEAGTKLIVVRPSDKGKMAFYAKPNARIIKDATDMAYRVRGKNAPEKFEVEQTGLRSLSDQELADLIKKQKARFNKTD